MLLGEMVNRIRPINVTPTASAVVIPGAFLATVEGGVYLFAVLQHFLVMIFVRQREDYDVTLLAYAYASALALLSWVPIVGYLASLYGLYVTMLGIRELHGTSTTRAFLAVLVPLLVFLASTVWSFWP